MTNAVGTKKTIAERTHRLIEAVPLCAAAAIQRGPRTAAMLNSSTSQKTHLLAQLFEGIGRAVHRLAHRVTSSAGINSSCMRKFLKKGSVEFSKPAHGPK